MGLFCGQILYIYTTLHYTTQPANHLSPGMFLCTPKPSGNNHRGSGNGGGASSSLSSRPSSIVPGLTPTNFASDFGKGHRKEDSLNAMDASNGTSSVPLSRFRACRQNIITDVFMWQHHTSLFSTHFVLTNDDSFLHRK